MLNLLVVILLATATPPKVSIAMSAQVTPELAHRRDAIAASLSPSAKLKLQNVATWLRTSNSITDRNSRAAILSAFPGMNFSDSDISAVMFITMMYAAESAQQDLQTIMGQVDALNKQKQALRQQLSKTQIAPHVQKVQVQRFSLNTFSVPPPLSSTASVQEKQKRLDDLDALGELAQLQLQALNDQRQQSVAVASSILQKTHDAQNAIIKNLK